MMFMLEVEGERALEWAQDLVLASQADDVVITRMAVMNEKLETLPLFD
jgi:hypothetical protein